MTPTFPPLKHVRLVGFGHRARQGKDTAIRALQELLPGQVLRAGFAEDLYAYCRIAHGMTVKDPILLQDVGEQHRSRDEWVWVKSLAWKLHHLDSELDAPRLVCVADVRHPNEACYIEEMGGVLCRLVRRNADGSQFISPDRPADHPSESAMQDYPWPVTIEHYPGDFGGITTGVRALVQNLHFR
jgi:hypothetical protein